MLYLTYSEDERQYDTQSERQHIVLLKATCARGLPERGLSVALPVCA